jgi:hypothetical protein
MMLSRQPDHRDYAAASIARHAVQIHDRRYKVRDNFMTEISVISSASLREQQSDRERQQCFESLPLWLHPPTVDRPAGSRQTGSIQRFAE